MNGRIALVLGLFVFLFFGGCMPGTTGQESQGESHVMVDGTGRTVRVPSHPRRVYATTSNLEDLSLALVGAERMAGVRKDSTEEGSLCREEAQRVSLQLPGNEIPAETILAMQPDVIILQEREVEQRELLEGMGLTVVALPVATNRKMVEDRIGIVAEALGEREKGKNILREFRQKLQTIEEEVARIPVEERPIAIAFGENGAFGSEGGLLNSIFTDAGLRNGAAMAGLGREAHLSQESILAVDPDYFVIPMVEQDGTKEVSTKNIVDEIRSNPAYRNLKVFQEGHIVFIPNRYRSCNSHHYADGVVFLHRLIYGKQSGGS